MIQTPKRFLLENLLRMHGRAMANRIKQVPEFGGVFVAIHPKPMRWPVDGLVIQSPGPVTVISTYRVDRLAILKPWQCRKDGKPYGAKWVGISNDTGKRKYFKLDDLAQMVFGPEWEAVKDEIKNETSKALLGELS